MDTFRAQGEDAGDVAGWWWGQRGREEAPVVRSGRGTQVARGLSVLALLHTLPRHRVQRPPDRPLDQEEAPRNLPKGHRRRWLPPAQHRLLSPPLPTDPQADSTRVIWPFLRGSWPALGLCWFKGGAGKKAVGFLPIPPRRGAPGSNYPATET